MANDNDRKRQKMNNNSVDDDDEDSESPTKLHFLSQQNSLYAMFDGEFLLSEALPYLDTVSIVDKKIVSRQWEEKCNVAINNKGPQVKKRFDGKRQLRGAVERYCEGNRDKIENIAEEYGYPIGKWDVSRVEDFSYVFFMKSFNEDIGAWDVGNATDMEDMFRRARSFNQSLSGWDVSNVKNMSGMFCTATAFNGDVSAWDTSNVTNMSHMFYHASAFNGDVSSWDTSKVTYMGYMFYHATAFDGNISSWNVSRVTEMHGMLACEDEDKFSQDRLNLIKSNWKKQGKRWW